ncbi:hypothetical protein [Microvirga sp. G4-2]|uniref:hypothetical protein n=1 Tax=Microvirga sp. G4-2 TaxID=3434467 RepID=UPI004044EF48
MQPEFLLEVFFWVAVFLWPLSLIWYGRMNYRHGIWDGSSNQFLPHVRKEIEWYRGHPLTESEIARLMDFHHDA